MFLLLRGFFLTSSPACVAWRFCRAGRRSGVAAKFAREARENERRSHEKNKVAPAPISSRFLCPRLPLSLSAPNQNRHDTQASVNLSYFYRNNEFQTTMVYFSEYSSIQKGSLSVFSVTKILICSSVVC